MVEVADDAFRTSHEPIGSSFILQYSEKPRMVSSDQRFVGYSVASTAGVPMTEENSIMMQSGFMRAQLWGN